MTRALLITNPVAARTEARAVTAVRETLRRGGWVVDVLATGGAGDARRFAEEAKGQGFDVLVAYGGDGTAMQVAAAIAGSGIPLGLIPGGTGNLLAGNLRLPRRPVAAARALLKARPRPIDLGAVERADGTHYFAVCCGAGFDAELMRRTESAAKRRWKMAAYVGRALTALPRVTSAVHRITVDGQVRRVPAAMVLVMNCGELIPPFLRLGGQIVPDDGWFDVVALAADGVIASVAAFLRLLRGAANGVGSGRLWTGRGRSVGVAVEAGAPRAVQLDGEVEGETPFEARLVPHALTVLVDPETAPPPSPGATHG
ncbi:MAG: diacylglycerol kinase family lipid kinase [Gemmatimonadetes bacterium]|nr:diacylglycerol kinase family lipid kinase [Gemmatimonadota bacterium]